MVASELCMYIHAQSSRYTLFGKYISTARCDKAQPSVVQAAQEAQSQKRKELLASIAALTANSLQGSSPGAVVRKAAAHQASAKTVLQQVPWLSLCTSGHLTVCD